MRQLGIAFGVWLVAVWSLSASAYEIEAERVFGAEAATERLSIISTADLDVFTPVLEAFLAENPGLALRYVVASSAELQRALQEEGAVFDVALSSAMDLQTKLANDGYAQAHQSAAVSALPRWARWRDHLFAFTQEPAVAIIAERALKGAPPPRNRAELVELLRRDQDLFRGKIGVYDVRKSGLGYLFATQDARQSESFWRLTEVMGALSPKLYCCSGDMISGLRRGELLLAYNVLGSYAATGIDESDPLLTIPLDGYTNIMLRTALIPRSAQRPALGGRFIDFLASRRASAVISEKTGLSPLNPAALAANPAFRPIRLGPGLLVYQDQLKRRAFIKAWEASMFQQ